jgi:flagellar biosynthesis protein FliR
MIVSILQTQIFVLVLTRVLMIMLALPFLGGSMVPNQVKISLGFILSMFVFPWQAVQPASAEAIPLIAFVQAIFQEVIIGALAGMAVTMVFGVFQVAAKMMEMSAGFSSGQIFNPTLNDTGSAFDQFFVLIIYLYFFAINGHHVFLIGLQQTFQALPVNSGIDKLMALTPDRLLTVFSMIIASGVQMALPIVGSILLADISLGLLNKVAPQIQVFFLGINIKIWAGLIGISLTLSYVLPTIRGLINNIGMIMSKFLGA